MPIKPALEKDAEKKSMGARGNTSLATPMHSPRASAAARVLTTNPVSFSVVKGSQKLLTITAGRIRAMRIPARSLLPCSVSFPERERTKPTSIYRNMTQVCPATICSVRIFYLLIPGFLFCLRVLQTIPPAIQSLPNLTRIHSVFQSQFPAFLFFDFRKKHPPRGVPIPIPH